MPNEFQYDVFPSHRSKDDAFVRELQRALAGLKQNVWIDSRELLSGASCPSSRGWRRMLRLHGPPREHLLGRGNRRNGGLVCLDVLDHPRSSRSVTTLTFPGDLIPLHWIEWNSLIQVRFCQIQNGNHASDSIASAVASSVAMNYSVSFDENVDFEWP